MGRKIDMLFFSALSAATGFLYFYWATHAFYMALVLTIAFEILLMILFHYISHWHSARNKRVQAARARIEQWLYMPYEEALSEAQECVRRNFPDGNAEGTEYQLIQQHPQGQPFDATQAIVRWRDAAARNVKALVLLNTGRFDERARPVCETLRQPRVCLLDARQLNTLLLQTPSAAPDALPSAKHRWGSWRVLGKHLVNRKRAPRCALYGALMLTLYLLLGTWTYLPIALFLLGLSALGMKRERLPSSLF